MNLEQLIGLAELRQQVRDVSHDLWVTNTDLLRIVPSHQLLEKLPQRMRFRNHASLGSLKAVSRTGSPMIVSN